MNTIPAPTDAVEHSAFCSAPNVLTVAGPAWLTEVIDAMNGSPLFPAARFVDEADATVRVEAPASATTMPTDLPDSSYTLKVTSESILVSAAEPAGVVAAFRTLQSLRRDGGFACAEVNDAPRYRYRGLHLDVARHFFDAAFVRRLIGVLASLGFNVLHWHLTEDQGWRLPVPGRPRLTDVGAYRTESDGTVYGGHYSREDIVDVVRHAGRLGMLVIPEIELPGHARAALASYPELSCLQEPVSVWNRWGICEDVFCAGNEQVFSFLEEVFDVVVELFPSRYVHLGGDECPKTRWKACPKCRERMKDEGLADEEELQSYFVGRAARELEARGRIAIGWDEILEGGLPEGTVVMSWRGTEGGARAAEMGHDVIMTPTSHCYFDHRQVDDPDELGFTSGEARPPVLTINKVLEFDPVAGISPEAANRVIGGQANVWTERMDTPAKVEYMVVPRILAMAEALWTAPDERDSTEFRTRAVQWLSRLEPTGWNAADLPE